MAIPPIPTPSATNSRAVQHLNVIVDPTVPALLDYFDVADNGFADPSSGTRNPGRTVRRGGSGRQPNKNKPASTLTGYQIHLSNQAGEFEARAWTLKLNGTQIATYSTAPDLAETNINYAIRTNSGIPFGLGESLTFVEGGVIAVGLFVTGSNSLVFTASAGTIQIPFTVKKVVRTSGVWAITTIYVSGGTAAFTSGSPYTQLFTI